jgi:superfamily II DNA helicase RecQ
VRADLARQRQLPAYCIAHDTTLIAIAQAAPATAAELEMVKGMSATKVKLYGVALLGAVNGTGVAADAQAADSGRRAD